MPPHQKVVPFAQILVLGRKKNSAGNCPILPIPFNTIEKFGSKMRETPFMFAFFSSVMIVHEYLYLCVKYDSCQIIRNIFYSFKTYCVFHQCTCWDQRGLGPKGQSPVSRLSVVLFTPVTSSSCASHLVQNKANA